MSSHVVARDERCAHIVEAIHMTLDELKDVETVILGSGGLKGLVLVGLFRRLREHHGITFEKLNKVVGTSVGAVIGLCLAMRDRVDFSTIVRVLKEEVLQKHTVDLSTLWVDTPSLNDMTHIGSAIAVLLKSGGLSTYMTVAEFTKVTGVDLTVVCCDLLTGSPVYLNAATAGDMRVLDAVQASMRIPLIFPPLEWRGMLLVDGALAESVPISRISTVEERSKSLVVFFDCKQVVSRGDVRGLRGMLQRVMALAMTRALCVPLVMKHRTLHIPVHEVKGYDMSADDGLVESLTELGECLGNHLVSRVLSIAE